MKKGNSALLENKATPLASSFNKLPLKVVAGQARQRSTGQAGQALKKGGEFGSSPCRACLRTTKVVIQKEWNVCLPDHWREESTLMLSRSRFFGYITTKNRRDCSE